MGQLKILGRISLISSTLINLAIAAMNPADAAPRGGFSEFAGSWTGSGQVESASGSEAIRCRARRDGRSAHRRQR